jgi:hypothetical protein
MVSRLSAAIASIIDTQMPPAGGSEQISEANRHVKAGKHKGKQGLLVRGFLRTT